MTTGLHDPMARITVSRGADELSPRLQEAAAALAERFGDVEVRVTRTGGSAWLVTHPDEVDRLRANSWIGIGVREDASMYVYLEGEALRYVAEGDRNRAVIQNVRDVSEALELIARVSIAGDPVEIGRRRLAQTIFDRRQASFRKYSEQHCRERIRGLSGAARERALEEERDAFDRGRAELTAAYWARIRERP